MNEVNGEEEEFLKGITEFIILHLLTTFFPSLLLSAAPYFCYIHRYARLEREHEDAYETHILKHYPC